MSCIEDNFSTWPERVLPTGNSEGEPGFGRMLGRSPSTRGELRQAPADAARAGAL